MFIKDSLLDLLNELSGAQESIEKVSVWIQQYRDQAPVIAQAWKSFYIEATQEKKLTLLFLVNDVLQHSKRKGNQFVDAFGHILPKCMSECKNSEAKSQIERMLDIWETREIFHKHIISAMKYSLDDIGMDDSHVKLTDLMDSLDLLRSQEKNSSEVLTKLSHRLDTTDFANAFNVTSRKEGDKYAADFDETAHFLDQYCSCLLKQTEARSSMIKKINTTMFQMEKTDETIKKHDLDYKSQQGTLVRTRKAITARLMLIDEGKVNFGDESPDREEIENLTSEEEDVDIEGIETIESKRNDKGDADRPEDHIDDDFNRSFADDGIRPEDAIDEQLPYAKPREKKKPKKAAKKLPSYDPRQILSYGFRLDAPPNGEQAVGFMLLPDGTLAAVPIAPHMFLSKPQPASPKPEKEEADQMGGPKTPDEIIDDGRTGPKTPDMSELEEGEVSESDNEVEEPKEQPEGYDDEVDGVPFDILEDGYHTDEDKQSASSPGSAPSMPSPEVSDEEDPHAVAMRNVSSWKDEYNELDGEAFEETKAPQGSPSSSEEGELSEDENEPPVKTGMTGLASILDRLSDGEEKKSEERSEYEQFYPPGYLQNSAKSSSKPAYLLGSNVSPKKPLEAPRQTMNSGENLPSQDYSHQNMPMISPEPRMRPNTFGYHGDRPLMRPNAPPPQLYNGASIGPDNGPRFSHNSERGPYNDYGRHDSRHEIYSPSPPRYLHSPTGSRSPMRTRSPQRGRSPSRRRSPPRGWSPPHGHSPPRGRSPVRSRSPPRKMQVSPPYGIPQQHYRPPPLGPHDIQRHPPPYPSPPMQRHSYPPPRQPGHRPLSYFSMRPLYINQGGDNRPEEQHPPMNHFLGVSPRAMQLEGVGSGGIIEVALQTINCIRLALQCVISICVLGKVIRQIKFKLKWENLQSRKLGFSPEFFDRSRRNYLIYVVTGHSYGPPLPGPQRPAVPQQQYPGQQSTQQQFNHHGQHPGHVASHSSYHEQTYYSEELPVQARQQESRPPFSDAGNSYSSRTREYSESSFDGIDYSSGQNEEARYTQVQLYSNNEQQHLATSNQYDYGIQKYPSSQKFGPPLPSSASANAPVQNNSQIYYKDESEDDSEYFEPAVQRYSSSNIFTHAQSNQTHHRPGPPSTRPPFGEEDGFPRGNPQSQRPPSINEHVSKSNVDHRKRRPRPSSSSDDMSESSEEAKETAPFADLPPPKVCYKDETDKPFRDIPAPRLPGEPKKGIKSANFVPFNESLFNEKQKFKPLQEGGSEVNYTSFPNKSIFNMLKEENAVTSIDRIINCYDLDDFLQDSEEEELTGPSLLQSIFGGESRMAPDYKAMDREREKEAMLIEMNRPKHVETPEKQEKKKSKRGIRQDSELVGQKIETNPPTLAPPPRPPAPVAPSFLQLKPAVTTKPQNITTSTPTTTSSAASKPKLSSAEMEAKRAEVLAKIALFKEQNEKEKKELAELKKKSKGEIVIKGETDPATLTNTGKKDYVFDIEAARARAQKALDEFRGINPASAATSSTSLTTSTVATTSTAITTVSLGTNIRGPDATLSTLPSFYQTAVQGIPPPSMPSMPTGAMPGFPQMPMNMGFNQNMGMPGINMNMGMSNMNMSMNMPMNMSMGMNVNMPNQNWYPHQNMGMSHSPRPSPSIITAPPVVRAPRIGGPPARMSGNSLRPRNPVPVSQPLVPGTEPRPPGTVTPVTRPVSKVHNLQLASSQASSQIRIGNSVVKPSTPAVPKITTPVDAEKMKKALEVKQKLEEGMKKFAALQQKGVVVKRQRFDVPPDITDQKTATEKEETVDKTQSKEIVKPESGVDLDDIDNLVNTDGLDLDLDF